MISTLVDIPFLKAKLSNLAELLIKFLRFINLIKTQSIVITNKVIPYKGDLT